MQPGRNRQFAMYVYLWTAFNNIYTTIAFTEGQHVTLLRDRDGAIITRRNGSVDIPKVRTVSEKDQLLTAFAEFDDELRHRLVDHPSTGYFVERTPLWHGQSISHDARGQRLNGVINVNYTTDRENPIWSPVDIKAYERYLANQQDSAARDQVAWQIVELLYTIRCNLVHGGKRADDANDIEVVERALPLLQIILNAFIHNAPLLEA